MAIKLRHGESVRLKAILHWSCLIPVGISTFITLMAAIGFMYAGNKGSDALYRFLTLYGYVLLGICIFQVAWAWLSIKSREYVITNERVHVEVGVLLKFKKDIPLEKINDVSTSEGIFQRIFGSGNVVILTGNDTPLSLKDIDDVESFASAVASSTKKAS